MKYLAENHQIHVVYGGAFIDEDKAPYSIAEIHLANKRMRNYEEKQVIARKAVNLIHDGETIALNAGSTAEYILDYLENTTHLNVITLSAHVALKATNLPFVSVYMPGGKMRSPSGVLYGGDNGEF